MTHTIVMDDIGVFHRGRDVAPIVEEYDFVTIARGDPSKPGFRVVPDRLRETLIRYLNGKGAEQFWSVFEQSGGLQLRMVERDEGYMRGGSPVTIGEVS